MQKTYTVKQVAEILGYSTNSIYTFLKEKRIKSIRAGRGSFRIPQSEFNRILLWKKPIETTQSIKKDVISSPSSPSVPPVLDKAQLPIEFATNSLLQTDVPSLFDWFIGIASILFGISMSLFSTTQETVAISSLLSWSTPLKIALISAGAGILISDITNNLRSFWHKLFHLVLFASYSIVTAYFIFSQDFQGALMFGSLATTLLITFFLDFGGIKSFILCLFAIIITFPLGVITTGNIPLQQPFNLIYEYPLWFLAVTTIINCICIFLLLKYKYKKKQTICFFITAFFVVIFSVLSIVYAQQLYWTRALFLLLTSLVSIFIPWWESFHFYSFRGRILMVAAFGSILGVFAVTVTVILLMQQNAIELAKLQLKNKANYGQLTLEYAIHSIHTSLDSVGQNPLLSNQLAEKKDSQNKQILMGIARTLFEGNRNIRRVIIMDKDGNEQAHYPYDTAIEGQNFSYRDYFQKTIQTKKTFVSNVFESVINKPAVVVSSPIFDKDDEIVGVIVGSLNIEGLGLNLEQISADEFGEHFIIADAQGKYIYHPKSDLTGTSVPNFQNVYKAKASIADIGEGSDSEGVRILQAYKSFSHDIEGEEKWTIIIQSPLTRILHPTTAAIFTLYTAVACIVVVIILILFIVHMQKYRQFTY